MNEIENLTLNPSESESKFIGLDEIIKNEDYFWYQDYLDSLSTDTQRDKVKEYILLNYPEFLNEDEEIVEDEKFYQWNANKDLVKNFEKSSNVCKDKTKNDLTDALYSTNTEFKDIVTW